MQHPFVHIKSTISSAARAKGRGNPLSWAGVACFLLVLISSPSPAQTIFTHDTSGDRITQAASTGVTTPVITSQPVTQLGQVGGTYSFSVVASGGGTLTYQWYKNGAAITGATTDTLAISDAQSSDFTNHANGSNSYDVKVTNSAGNVVSNTVALYLDTNAVGIPDWWQIQYFGAIGIAPDADADGDGVSNIQEYLDGTDPTNASAHDYTLVINGPVVVQPSMPRYPPGTVVTLSVPGSVGAYFLNWSGDASGTSNPLTVVMNSNKNITAVTSSVVTPTTAPLLSASTRGSVATVNSVLVQSSDQKIVAAGAFVTLDGRPQWGVGRLTTTGALDTTFFPGAGDELPVNSNQFGTGVADMVEDSQGRLIVVGFPGSGSAAPSIYRINTDGTLDTTFVASSPTFVETVIAGGDFAPFQGSVTSVALDANGNILIGGNFNTVGGVTRNNIARLNAADGSLDTTFDPGTAFAGTGNGAAVGTHALAVNNGKIYAAGYVEASNFNEQLTILRFSSTGTVDTTFNASTALSGLNYTSANFAMLVRPGGGVLVGTANSLKGLTSTGALDSTFSAPAISGVTALAAANTQATSPIIVGENDALVRVSSTGALDSTLNVTINGVAQTIAVQSNGDIVIGGNILAVNGTPEAGLARLSPTGVLDTTAKMNAGGALPNSEPLSGAFGISALVEQPDGKVLVGGNFQYLDNNNAPNLVRLNPDSTFDTTFNPGGSGPDGPVNTVLFLPSGKIFVGGFFANYNGTPAAGYVQLNADGSIDTTFPPGPSGSSVLSAVLHSNGEITVAGSLLNQTTALELLKTDGSQDTAFTPVINPAENDVAGMALQSDGKLLIGGFFSELDTNQENFSAPGFVRLNADGSIDTTFNATSVTTQDGPSFINVLPSGQILIAGENVTLQRLNADGSPDTTYGLAFQNNVDTEITAVTVLPDGSALFGNQSSSGAKLFRLTPNGTLDTSFNLGLNNYATAILTRSNGEIYAGGPFTTDAQDDAVGLVRFSAAPNIILSTVGVSTPSPISPGTAETLTATVSAVEGQVADVFFQVSTDNVNFTDVAQATTSGSNIWTGQWTPTSTGSYYLRAYAVDSSLNTAESIAIANFTVASGTVTPPQITTQPVSLTVAQGSAAAFSVTATGGSLSYQWKLNGVNVVGTNVVGQNTPTLSITNAALANAGTYTVVVSNSAGSLSSQDATLTVQQTFAQWETSFGVSGSEAATPQGDGVPNLLKFVFGINHTGPMTTADRNALPHLAVTTTGALTLTYYQSPASSALVVTPQTSFDLVNWSTAPPAVQIGTDPATGDSIMQVQIQAPQARQFLRLRVPEP